MRKLQATGQSYLKARFVR